MGRVKAAARAVGWVAFRIMDEVTLGPWRARRRDAARMAEADWYRARGMPHMAEWIETQRECRSAPG